MGLRSPILLYYFSLKLIMEEEIMNSNKIGKFIASLRKEQNLTQEELANKLIIGREAVSKWERGKTIPDQTSLLNLSELFNVSINEILYGEKLNKDNETNISNLILTFWKKNKLKRNIILLISLLFVLLISFFIYYFLRNYNSMALYELRYYSLEENLRIEKGVIAYTNDKMYLNLGNVITDKDIEWVEVYYLDKENKEKFVIGSNGTHFGISLWDTLGYEGAFDLTIAEHIVNNLYVKLTFDEYSLNIKLDAMKIFDNKRLFPHRVPHI